MPVTVMCTKSFMQQNLADGSLGEGTGKKLGRMSVKDLANCESDLASHFGNDLTTISVRP